jgi:hypothetical protein
MPQSIVYFNPIRPYFIGRTGPSQAALFSWFPPFNSAQSPLSLQFMLSNRQPIPIITLIPAIAEIHFVLVFPFSVFEFV